MGSQDILDSLDALQPGPSSGAGQTDSAPNPAATGADAFLKNLDNLPGGQSVTPPPTGTAFGIPFNEKQTAFTYGMGEGATAGFLPDIHSAISSLTGGAQFGQMRDQDRAQLDAAYKAHPWLYDAGYVGGMGILANAVGPLALTSRVAAAPFLERAGPAVVDAFGMGTLYGTGESRAPTTTERLSQGLKTGLEAAPFGPAFEAVAPIVGAIWGRTPDPAATAAVNQAKQFGISLDRGQATGDVATQRYLDESKSGLHGGMAERAARQAATNQAEAVEAAKGQIQSGMGPNQLGSSQDAGDVLSQSVQDKVKTLQNTKDALYAQAAQSNSRIVSSQLPDLYSGIDAALAPAKPMLDAKQSPITQSLRDYISQALPVPKNPMSGMGGVEVNDIERVRQIINANAPMRGTPDYRTYTMMKNAFDDWYDTAIQKGLMSGDPNVLNQIRQARGAVTELKGITRPPVGDDAGKIISKWADPNANVTPAEIANSLTGMTKIGSTGTSVRLAQRLNQMFGANSPEMDAVRQAVWLKATMAPLNRPNPGPQAVKNSLDFLLDGGGKYLAQQLFDPNKQASMRSFKDVLGRLTPNQGATNPPNSGSRAAAFLQSAWDNTMTALLAGAGHLPGAAMFKIASPMFRSFLGAGKTNTLLNRPIPSIPNPSPGSLARFSPVPGILANGDQSQPFPQNPLLSPFSNQ